MSAPVAESVVAANGWSEKYTELAELAGRLVHEIKNHLGTLSLNLQLLEEELHEPETNRERRALHRVQRLRTECSRLTDLSTDFLRFARLREINAVATNLKDVVEEMLDFYAPTARQAGIEIKAFVSADLPPVLLDRELFKQAILNLILNAVQAMPEGGELTIQGDCRGEEVCLSFIDTGVGMTPEVQAQIFRPFFSSRPGGSGLGLPTTRRIIEAHGGRIEVLSEPGHGTKFTILLPAAPSV